MKKSTVGKSRRPLRVAEMVREELSEIMRQGMRDPRLKSPWVTITEVDMSPDLKNAKVYFSTLAQNADINELQKALQGAAAYLRTALAHRLESGYGVPTLQFFHDTHIDSGLRMEALIDSAIQRQSPDHS